MKLKNRVTGWTTRVVWLSLTLILSACAPYYYREPPAMGPGPGGDVLHNIERYRFDLKLTREQIEKIRQLRANFEREAIRINAALRVAYLDLGSLIHPDRKQIDKDKVFKKLDEISGLHTQMQRKMVELQLDVIDLLTEEQYEKFSGLLKNRPESY